MSNKIKSLTAEEMLDNALESDIPKNGERCVITHSEAILAMLLFSDQEKRTEAIAFAEWISGEGYRQYDGHDRWIAPHQSNDVYETPALYDLFTVSKPPIQ